MGARSGGGSRGGGGAGARSKNGGYTYLQESEKAVKVNLEMYVEYAPNGGFTSSMIKDKNIRQEVWIPKSQLIKGEPTTWIMNTKASEVAEYHSPMNGRVLHMQATFTDAKGKRFKGSESAISKKIRLDNAARYNAGKQKHDALVQKAKSMGIKGVRVNITSAKLQQMIDNASK